MPAASSAVVVDQVIVLRDIPWAAYEVISRAISDTAGVRTAYLEGELELMSPGRTHEHLKKLLARLIGAWADVRELPLNGFGSETYRKKARKAGLEPDESYILGPEKKVADLAVEVIVTAGSVDKLEIYRRFGVGEVWFLEDGRLHLHGLEADGDYRRLRRSRLLRGFPIAEVERLLAETDPSDQATAVRAFRRSLT